MKVLQFINVKASELKPGDLVHMSTGLWKVVKVEPSDLSDGAWPRVVMNWLKYPYSFKGEVCHPDCEFLKQV